MKNVVCNEIACKNLARGKVRVRSCSCVTTESNNYPVRRTAFTAQRQTKIVGKFELECHDCNKTYNTGGLYI